MEVGGEPIPPHTQEDIKSGCLNRPSSKALELGNPEDPGLDPSHLQQLVKRPKARLRLQGWAQFPPQDFKIALGRHCPLTFPGPAQNTPASPASCRSKVLPG